MSYQYSLLRFVPDPARGEFVNFGIIAGDDDSADWELRLIQNLRRAKALDDKDVLPMALAFADRVETHIDVLRQLPETSSVAPISEALLETFAAEMQNIVQVTKPAPVVADSAEEALDMLFEELLVDPATRQHRFLKKHRAVGSTRRAYREHGVPDESIKQHAPVNSGAYDGMFDFAVFNGQVVQLVQCWSFQLPNQADLAEEVKAWAWVVQELRGHGGTLKLAGRDIDVRPGADVEIAVVAIPPMDGQEDTRAFDEARAACKETGVEVLPPDEAGRLGVRAAEQLHVLA